MELKECARCGKLTSSLHQAVLTAGGSQWVCPRCLVEEGVRLSIGNPLHPARSLLPRSGPSLAPCVQGATP